MSNDPNEHSERSNEELMMDSQGDESIDENNRGFHFFFFFSVIANWNSAVECSVT